MKTLALMILLATGGNGLVHTKPANWAKAGWQKSRWGMGAGDVAAVLGPLHPVKSNDTNGKSLAYETDAPVSLFLFPMTVHLEFPEGHLRSVELDTECMGNDNCDRIFLSLRNGLYRKYGADDPTLDGADCFGHDAIMCEWNVKGLRISLNQEPPHPPQIPAWHVFLSYTDAVWIDQGVREMDKKSGLFPDYAKEMEKL